MINDRLEKSLKKYLNYGQLVEISAEIGEPIAPPITASISVSSKCNSDCMYCSFRTSLNKSKLDIPFEKLKEIINSMNNVGVRILTFTGGEPLMRKDILELVLYAKKYDMTVHITSNGILLSEEMASQLSEAGVSNIIVSIDSIIPSIYEKQRGVLFLNAQKALKSLKYFAYLKEDSYGLVTVVVTKLNYQHLEEFVKNITEYGQGKILVNIQPYHKQPDLSKLSQDHIDSISEDEWNIYHALKSEENELIPDTSEKESFDKIIENLIKMKTEGYPINNSEYYLRSMSSFLIENKLPSDLVCKAGFTGIYIQENLNMLPCWRLPEIGNLNESKLEDVWFSEDYAKKREDMMKGKCPNCMFLCHNETGWYEWYDSIYKSS